VIVIILTTIGRITLNLHVSLSICLIWGNVQGGNCNRIGIIYIVHHLYFIGRLLYFQEIDLAILIQIQVIDVVIWRINGRLYLRGITSLFYKVCKVVYVETG